MHELQADAVALLQRLIRIDTVNPPGAERPAMELLEGYLLDAGFETELLGAEPDRPNLIARLRGAADGPTLCYLGHVDTVLADASEWRHGPWSGELADGCVWGRGALDMKGQVAAEAAAGAALARGGWRPARGELLLCFVVDEETGGALGAQWLTREHPEKVRCDMLLNEGGGELFELDGRRFATLGVGEKGVFRFTLTTHGTAGHASNPRLGDNALLKLAPLLDRMRERPVAFELGEDAHALLAALGVDGSDPAAALAKIAAMDPHLAMQVEPMLGVTVAPTRARASEKINVIPSRAELKVDCRVPPGLGADVALARVREVLGDDGYELSFDEQVSGNRSPLDSPLAEALRGWTERNDPGRVLVPAVLAGFTDSRWFRDAFPECDAYGWFPHLHMDVHTTGPLFHAPDERIDERDLGHAARCFADLARELLG